MVVDKATVLRRYGVDCENIERLFCAAHPRAVADLLYHSLTKGIYPAHVSLDGGIFEEQIEFLELEQLLDLMGESLDPGQLADLLRWEKNISNHSRMPSPHETSPEAVHRAVMRAICVNPADTPMVLKGGTALLLCYGLDRHSQDLDFDSPKKMALRHRIQEALGYRLRIIEFKTLKDTETVHRVRLRYTDSETQLEGTVRIETSFRQPPDASDLTLKNGIRAYKINKLFIQKTIAFYERTAARDFYDLAFLLSQSFIPDTQSLNKLHADFNDPQQFKSIEQRFRIAFETDPVLARYDFDKITLTLSERIEHAHKRVQALEEYNAQVKTPADRARLLNENPALVAARDEAYQAFKSDQVTQQLEQQQQQQSRSQAI